jgi:hypothetical protein
MPGYVNTIGCRGYTFSIVGLIDAITAVPGVRCLDDCDEWCVGLPLEGIRLLDSTEIDLLQTDVNRQYRRQRAYAVSFACAFVGLYLLTIFLSNTVLFWLTACDAVVMAVFVLWLVSEPDSWLRRNRALQADITTGLVHTFRHGSCAGPLEVLPRSEVVYLSNEFSPKKWRRALISTTAKTPAISSIASEWLQPVLAGPTGRFYAGKRELSNAEVAEINRSVDVAWSTPKRHAIMYLLWTMFLLWLWRSGSSELLLACLAFTCFSIGRVVPDLSRAEALRRDAEAGLVIINRRASIQNGEFVPLGRPAEYLPQAQVKWTEGGQPAEWRKLS